jgi:hypothetical protein
MAVSTAYGIPDQAVAEDHGEGTTLTESKWST